ncbi:hypothetical protein UCRPA7_1972 [Phaeoacremonium minimum UCRPA7]|uniref:Uncharacterized protein n=1 Tax=Phaeoacremonium minimum (strain UCR-PA7) TaxID=1286976 RepID=R8BT00_PHAM7|nr:hypothetical protein UCRPA7_1972 [Phaeoacremonium minimum UCRPA7]EOO02523.1 hypothetical protein UCRPA7_1972 [Phaeoacremonium minimum UCRPA7]
MAAPKEQSSDKLALSDREVQLAVIAWQCIEGDAKIQLDKFARLAQYATTESARTNWSRIKSKLKAIGEARDNDGTSHESDHQINDGEGSAKKKATPRKRKAAEGESTEEQNGGTEGSPAGKAAKRRRPRPVKATKSVKAEEGEYE